MLLKCWCDFPIFWRKKFRNTGKIFSKQKNFFFRNAAKFCEAYKKRTDILPELKRIKWAEYVNDHYNSSSWSCLWFITIKWTECVNNGNFSISRVIPLIHHAHDNGHKFTTKGAMFFFWLGWNPRTLRTRKLCTGELEIWI